MKPMMIKYVSISLMIYFISYFICSFFGKEGQEAISHVTGMVTMILLLLAATACAFSNKLTLLSKVMGIVSSVSMFIGYFIYIYLEISPSVISNIAHTASSVLFDFATSAGAIFAVSVALDLHNNQED